MTRISILIILLLTAGLAFGQPWPLDKIFGDEGVVISKMSDVSEYAMTVAVLPDGKILQCGAVYSEDGLDVHLILRRYHSNGTLDSSFASNGTYLSTIVHGLLSAKIFPYADGRILIVGQTNTIDSISHWKTQYSPFALRILSGGSTDDSFGTKGIFSEYTTDIFEEYCSALISENGDIVLVGARGDSSNMLPVITKLDFRGRKLSSFGDNGKVIIHPNAEQILITDANINVNGDCVFGGSSGVIGQKNTIVIRTDMTGKSVSSFGNSGLVTSAVFDADEEVRAVKISTDGSVLCLIATGGEFYGRSSLIRLLYDGSPDLQFGDWGGTIYPERTDGRRAISFALDSNSNIAVVGYGGNYYGTAFCFRKDGNYNLKFGDGGEVTLFITPYSANYDIAVQPDGKYVIVGWYYSGQATSASMMYRLDPAQLSIISERKNRVSLPSLHPTPSLDNCTITYTLPSSGNCTMTLSDESGRQVRAFATNEYRTAGEHKEELDLRGLAAGVYFLQVESDGATQTTKLIKQ
jgi:uncharacterized delta-60 repeat protein